MRRSSYSVVLLFCILLATGALAYDGEIHQQLTFLAAKQFNQCVSQTDIPRLTPLQVRYMARTNVRQADRTRFARIFSWRYYHRGGEQERSVMWIVDTRIHEHYRKIQERLVKPQEDSAKRYSDLGRLIGYLQLVTSPAHVVPVFTGRFWRLSLSDRFDHYPVDEDAIAEVLVDDCDFLFGSALRFDEMLTSTANDTLAAVQEPIPGLPVTWEAFWEFHEDEDKFGSYGPAGNSFGRATRFRCGEEQSCVLLANDPLYSDFALARHVMAVRSSLLAIRLLQQSLEFEVAGSN